MADDKKSYNWSVGTFEEHPIARFTSMDDAGKFARELAELLGNFDCISDCKFIIVKGEF